MPIFPVRQNAHFIAQPTWVEMQKVCGGASGMKTDSMCLPSASRSRNLTVPSWERSCPATTGVVMTHASASSRAEIAAEIAHQREIGDPALVDPLENLTGVEARVAETLERLLELVPLAFRDVGPGMDGHDAVEPAGPHE